MCVCVCVGSKLIFTNCSSSRMKYYTALPGSVQCLRLEAIAYNSTAGISSPRNYDYQHTKCIFYVLRRVRGWSLIGWVEMRLYIPNANGQIDSPNCGSFYLKHTPIMPLYRRVLYNPQPLGLLLFKVNRYMHAVQNFIANTQINLRLFHQNRFSEEFLYVYSAAELVNAGSLEYYLSTKFIV